MPVHYLSLGAPALRQAQPSPLNKHSQEAGLGGQKMEMKRVEHGGQPCISSSFCPPECLQLANSYALSGPWVPQPSWWGTGLE